MLLRPRVAALLLALGSAALLGGAYAFQYWGGLAPCVLCLWQRKPHMAVIVLGVLAALAAGRRLPWTALMALAVLALWIGAGIGVFHAGVEQKWWQGTSECGALDAGTATSAEEMLRQIMEAPVVRCDEIAWQMWGLSMAGWNALASVLLGCFGLLAILRRGRQPA